MSTFHIRVLKLLVISTNFLTWTNLKVKIVPNFSDKPITNLNKLCLLDYLLNELNMQPKKTTLN